MGIGNRIGPEKKKVDVWIGYQVKSPFPCNNNHDSIKYVSSEIRIKLSVIFRGASREKNENKEKPKEENTWLWLLFLLNKIIIRSIYSYYPRSPSDDYNYTILFTWLSSLWGFDLDALSSLVSLKIIIFHLFSTELHWHYFLDTNKPLYVIMQSWILPIF